MPRSFWYHSAIACILSLGTAAISAGRGASEANALYQVFRAPDSPLNPASIPCLFALLGVMALIGVRISGRLRIMSFIALYAMALFVPFISLATHFWIDLLALLLLALSMRFLLEPYRGVKTLVTALLPLFAAILLRGQLAAAALVFPLYLLAAGRRKAAIHCIFLFALPYAALLSIELGAIGRIRALIPVPSAAGGPPAIENVLALFRTSIEFQLILGFMPFVLAAAVGLSARELKHDRSALFLNLLLFLTSLLLFPAALNDPGSARLIFMMLSLFTILSANSGILMLQEAARGPRALRWSVVLAGLFLLPALISVVSL